MGPFKDESFTSFFEENYSTILFLFKYLICLKIFAGLHGDIYLVKVMKVIFYDVRYPPVWSSEMASGWMPSSPDWTTAEMLLYPSPPRPT